MRRCDNCRHIRFDHLGSFCTAIPPKVLAPGQGGFPPVRPEWSCAWHRYRSGFQALVEWLRGATVHQTVAT